MPVPKKPRWEATFVPVIPGFPWHVRFRFANRGGQLVCTGIEIAELEYSPDRGLTRADLKRLSIDSSKQFFLDLLRDRAGATPESPAYDQAVTEVAERAARQLKRQRKGGRPRLDDGYLRKLALAAQELYAVGDRRPNVTLAKRYGVTRERIRDHLHRARKLGYLPESPAPGRPVMSAPDAAPGAELEMTVAERQEGGKR